MRCQHLSGEHQRMVALLVSLKSGHRAVNGFDPDFWEQVTPLTSPSGPDFLYVRVFKMQRQRNINWRFNTRLAPPP